VNYRAEYLVSTQSGEKGELMSPKTIWLLVALAVCNYPLAAQTYYVGTCKPGSFPTISAAVNSSSVTPGSTIKICAGFYKEQVIISKDLTVQGLDGPSAVQSGSLGSGAVIFDVTSVETANSAVFASNPILKVTFAPIIWVTAGTVNIQNISVYGAGGYPGGAKEVGFYYSSGASGTLNHVGFLGQGSAVGIWAENANNSQTSVTIENSYSDDGIVAGSLVPGKLAVKITGNQVSLTAPDLAYGIYVYQVSGIVETNFVSERGPQEEANSSPGIEVDGVAATDVTISGNSIQTTDAWEEEDFGLDWTGILINVDGPTVKSNKISGANIGIDMGCHDATVSGNTVMLAFAALNHVPAGFKGVNSLYNNWVSIYSC
jgi:hypothetical protein